MMITDVALFLTRTLHNHFDFVASYCEQALSGKALHQKPRSYQLSPLLQHERMRKLSGVAFIVRGDSFSLEGRTFLYWSRFLWDWTDVCPGIHSLACSLWRNLVSATGWNYQLQARTFRVISIYSLSVTAHSALTGAGAISQMSWGQCGGSHTLGKSLSQK